MNDRYNLQRFVDAQDGCMAQVLRELRSGEKQTHWMWFVFPQLRGLGVSDKAQFYGISSQAEAGAYLGHPVLGPRLIQCTELVNAVEGRSVGQIFPWPDHLKFHSCMTVFSISTLNSEPFPEALRKYFHGCRDERTVELLQG